jgi:hypothetical protein
MSLYLYLSLCPTIVSRRADTSEALKFFDKELNEPDIRNFEVLFEVLRRYRLLEYFEQYLQRMNELGLQPNAKIHRYIVEGKFLKANALIKRYNVHGGPVKGSVVA